MRRSLLYRYIKHSIKHNIKSHKFGLTENLPLINGGSYTEYDGEEEILYFQCDDPSKTAIPSDDREGKTKEYGQILIDNIQKPFCEGKKTCQQR